MMRGGRGGGVGVWTGVVTLALGLSLVSRGQAQPLKVGVVDLQAVLAGSGRGKAATARLQAAGEQLQREMQAKREAQARQEAELQQQRTALRSPGAGVSEPVRAAQEDELRKKTRAVQRFVEDANRWLEDATQELREKEARETQGLLRAIRQIIRELSEREGYQLVLEGNANTAVVLSFGKAIDLTPQVIQRFDHASAPPR